MTKAKAEKIRKGIEDKIGKTTVDMEWWAYFRGFTVEEYKEFLDMAVEAYGLKQEPKRGKWQTKTVKKFCAPDCWYEGIFAIEGSWNEEEGSWLEEQDGFCSECGKQDEHYNGHKYCSNCGAKMEG